MSANFGRPRQIDVAGQRDESDSDRSGGAPVACSERSWV